MTKEGDQWKGGGGQERIMEGDHGQGTSYTCVKML
jgi:hypothetical protein